MALCIKSGFPLVNDGPFVRIQKLNRNLDGEDMTRTLAVAVIISEASVVDLPDPVEPTTSQRHRA